MRWPEMCVPPYGFERADSVIVEYSFVAFENMYTMYWYLHSFETIHSQYTASRMDEQFLVIRESIIV